MTSAGPIHIIAALGIQPTYSARQAAVLLGDCNFFGVTPEKEGDTCDRCDE